MLCPSPRPTETGSGGSRLAGVISERAIPSIDSQPAGITVDRSGVIWFAEQRTDRIGRLPPDGVITEIPVAPFGNPLNIVATGDALYFTLYYGSAIGRLGFDGAYGEIRLFKNSHPLGITRKSDGSIWFTEYSEDLVGYFVPTEGLQRRRAVRY